MICGIDPGLTEAYVSTQRCCIGDMNTCHTKFRCEIFIVGEIVSLLTKHDLDVHLH